MCFEKKITNVKKLRPACRNGSEIKLHSAKFNGFPLTVALFAFLPFYLAALFDRLHLTVCPCHPRRTGHM